MLRFGRFVTECYATLHYLCNWLWDYWNYII